MNIRLQILDRARAYSLVEVLAIVAVISAVAVFLIYGISEMRAKKEKAQRIKCVDNLKNIGLSFRIWSTDSSDAFPFKREIGGSAQFTNTFDAFRHFLILSNELVTPRILKCPADSDRKPADSFSNLSNSNVSYFINLNAEETYPEVFLSGDRNVLLDGKPLSEGLHVLDTNANISWSATIHKYQGNIAMDDGSVHQSSTERLRDANQSLTNILMFP